MDRILPKSLSESNFSRLRLYGRCKAESNRGRVPFMGRIIIVFAIIVLAYWYWSELGKNTAETSTLDDPKRNAQIIADCVAQGGFEGVDSYKGSGQTPESICADKNNLYMTYGEWHRR